MFALYDHSENDPKIETCIKTIKNRLIYEQIATFEDLLNDAIFIEDFGVETAWLAFNAAKILVNDLNKKKR